MVHTATKINTLHDDLLALQSQIGNTPLIPIRRMFSKPGVQIFAKLEWHQLGQSVKARAAYQIILQAVAKGQLGPGRTLLDATSGNTGIAYAAIGAAVGLKVKLVVPANISVARRKILQAHGAELVFSSPLEGTDGAQQLAREIAESNPTQYYYADQYSNVANLKAHVLGTAPEIWTQTAGQITHFVTGLGTTGSFTGTATKLKCLNPDISAIALQPDIAMHALEGWKHLETAVVPKIYNPYLADAVEEVSTELAYATLRDAARLEGLILSPSAAANLAGAIQVARSLSSGIVVTLLPDNGDKYTDLLNEILA
jgi:S-sulfo-L-cysteine synthase (O-acetyl-L-serine-dependent)